MKIEDRLNQLGTEKIYFSSKSLDCTEELFAGRILYRFEDNGGLEFVSQECPIKDVKSYLFDNLRGTYFKKWFDDLRSIKNMKISEDNLSYDDLVGIIEEHKIVDKGLDIVYEFYLINDDAFGDLLKKRSK